MWFDNTGKFPRVKALWKGAAQRDQMAGKQYGPKERERESTSGGKTNYVWFEVP
jgi:hypothetical protein